MAKSQQQSEQGLLDQEPQPLAEGEQAIVIEVHELTNDRLGSVVVDGYDRFMPIEEAVRYDHNLKRAATVERPQLSGRNPPSEEDVFALTRYQQQLAGMPSLWPVKRVHGRTFRQPGFYVVFGKNVLGPIRVVQQDHQGKWGDAPGTEWFGPYITTDEARAAHNIGEFPKAPAGSVTGMSPQLIALTNEVRELRQQLAEARVSRR